MPSWCVTVTAIVLSVATASAEVIIEDLFDGGANSPTHIAGTAKNKYTDARAPLGVNLPGGKWTKVAGVDWSDPYIPAVWDKGKQDYLNLGENITGVAISLKGHNKGVLHLIADLNTSSSDHHGGIALGFYSELTPPNTRSGEMANFTGIKMSAKGSEAGTLQLFEAGKPVGEPVAIGPVEPGKFYTLQYDVDTATGRLSNVNFDGKDIPGLTSTAFTVAATAYAGIVQSGGQNGRGAVDNFQVSRE